MPITGKFIADFTSFTSAVNQATVQLTQLQTGSYNVEKSLQKMTDSFRGKQVIQEAQLMARAIQEAGGTANLTASELQKAGAKAAEAADKMKRMGEEVPPALRQIVAEAEKLNRVSAFDKAKDNLQAFGSAAKTIGAGMTAAFTVPIVGAAAAIAKLGIDAVESENLVSVSFGDMRQAADDWSKQLSKDLGLNEFEMRKMAGTLFNMTTAMGLSRDAAFKMSTGVAQLAADMASFRNIPIEEALNKIRSGLTGETEPLKAVGILVDEATVKQEAYRTGIAKTGEELTQQQKVMARWSAILRQTANDQGDLARTIDSPANQLRIFRSRLEEAGAALGTILMPFITRATGALRDLTPYLQDAIKWFKDLSPASQTAALGIAGVAAAAGPAIYLTGQLAGAVTNLIPLLEKLGKIDAGGKLIAFASNPYILGLALLAGGIAVGYNAWSDSLASLAANANPATGAIANLVDGTGKAKLTIDQAAEAAKNATGPIMFMGRAINEVAQPSGGGGIGGLTKQLADARKEIDALSPAMRDQLAGAIKSGAFSMKELQDASHLSEAALKLFQKQLQETKKEATETQKALQKLADAQEAARMATIPLTLAQKVQARALLETTLNTKEIALIVGVHIEQIETYKRQLEAEAKAHAAVAASVRIHRAELLLLSQQTVTNIGQLPNVQPANRKVIEDIREQMKLSDAFKKALHADLLQIPQMLANAFQGGNIKEGLKNAAKGIASMVGSTIGTGIGAAIGGPLGAAIGSALGSLAGAAGGALFGKLFKTEEKEVNKTREAFVQLHGGLANLNAEAARAGVSLDAMLKAKTVKDYEKALNDLNKALKLQEGLDALKKIRDQFIATQGGFEKLAKAAAIAGTNLDALFDAKTVEAYEKAVDELSKKLKFQDDAMKELEDTAKKYGLSIEELGPAFAAQQLDKKAQELFKDYMLLIAAGADHDAVIRRMGPSLAEYVKSAAKAGVAIPEDFRPIIQSLIDQGLLYDDQGNKITSVEQLGVTFAQTMEEKFGDMIDAIHELTDAIRSGLGLPLQHAKKDADDFTKAVNNIPRTVDIRINWIDPEGNPLPGHPGGGSPGGPPAQYMGGAVTTTGIVPAQYLAHGGRVRGAFWGSPKGEDTIPAWLSPGEIVLNQRQQRTLFERTEPRASPVSVAMHVFVEKDGTASIMTDDAAFNRKVQEAMRSGAVLVPSHAIVKQF